MYSNFNESFSKPSLWIETYNFETAFGVVVTIVQEGTGIKLEETGDSK